jgi:hypothetical protein
MSWSKLRNWYEGLNKVGYSVNLWHCVYWWDCVAVSQSCYNDCECRIGTDVGANNRDFYCDISWHFSWRRRERLQEISGKPLPPRIRNGYRYLNMNQMRYRCFILLPASLLVLLFDPEDGENTFFRYVDEFLANQTASHTRKKCSSNYYKYVNVPVVLRGCETWSASLMKEHRLRAFLKGVLRRMSIREGSSRGLRKLHSDNSHKLYSHKYRLS